MIRLAYDGSFDIATGRKRTETKWKNSQMLWSAFCERISQTHRTHETYKEYVAATKERQSEIKDVGGFVGGLLASGRRNARSVVHRQLLTLDIDYGTADSWQQFTILNDCAAAIYSTHKHSPGTVRLRLIIPLSRPVLADEYTAIGRRVAGDLGIELFDHTTFEAHRLMYWPSTSKDGEYVFEYQDGEWLDVDATLARYTDWHDTSEWPISERYNKLIDRAIKKQGDPLEKPGFIGAFCRVYPVDEVIEKYLADEYTPTSIDNRYTYAGGSTAGGLIIYDNKFAYSHHATDPISGKLCNAFDLVRLHKFGLKDEDAKEGTPSVKLPSYLAMLEFCQSDDTVRTLLGTEKLQELRDDFTGHVDSQRVTDGMSVDATGEVVDVNDVASLDWIGLLELDKQKGLPLSTIANVAIILENDPLLKGRFKYDRFRGRKIVVKSLPWRKVTKPCAFSDEDSHNIIKYMEEFYKIKSRQDIKDAVETHFYANSVHPVREYLDRCALVGWDGVKRVDQLFIDYMGADDSDYMRAVTRKTLVAAVARIMQPGCKFDYMTVLIGAQGLGKSTLIAKLGSQWFSDSFSLAMLHNGKEAVEQIQGYWIIEVAELTGMKRADIDSIKHFFRKQFDNFRGAYKENTVDVLRQCIFIGSTNVDDFLRDPTGNRGFWPVQCFDNDIRKSVWNDLTSAVVTQLWAEAIELYNSGEPLHLTPELEAQARLVQAAHTEEDSRASLIYRYLNTLLPDNWDDLDLWARKSFLRGDQEGALHGTVKRERVCAMEVWCECLEANAKDLDNMKARELNNVLKNMQGWTRHKSKMRFKIYGAQHGYIRSESE